MDSQVSMKTNEKTDNLSFFFFKDNLQNVTTFLSLHDIDTIYSSLKEQDEELRKKSIVDIELRCWLERLVWPYFPHTPLASLLQSSTTPHILDHSIHLNQYNKGEVSDTIKNLHYLKSLILFIILILNEKLRQRTAAWDLFKSDIKKNEQECFFKIRYFFYLAWFIFCYPNKFHLSNRERLVLLQFFIHVYQSLEQDCVRQVCMPFCSLASWLHLSERQQIYLLKGHPELRKPWKLLVNKHKQLKLKYQVTSCNNKTPESHLTALSPDSYGLSLEERFLLLERDAFVLSLRSMISFVENDCVQTMAPENINITREFLLTIPRTATDVFLGNYYETGETKQAEDFCIPGFVTEENTSVLQEKKKDVDEQPDVIRNENPSDLKNHHLLLLEKYLEFMIDLLAQLPTRRFFKPIFVAQQLLLRLINSPIFYHVEAALIRQLVAILSSYEIFEIDDISGEPLQFSDLEEQHYNRLISLQNTIYNTLQKDYPTLKQMALSPISKYESRQSLRNLFKNLPVTALLQIGNGLELLEALSFAQSALEPLLKLCTTDQADIESFSNTQEYQTGQKMLVEVFAHYLCRRTDSLTSINRLPLFPTEMLLWDPHIIPLENYQGDFSLALPKLNLQFLTLRDYLLRNFHLFRLESAYEIRQHLEETISQMEPHLSCAGSLTNTGTYLPVTQPYTKNITHFTHPQLSDASNLSTTWSATRFKNLSRWGVPIDRVSLVYITPPILGSKIPSQVRGEIVVNLNNVLKEFRDEWDTIRPNDVLFLISIQLPSNSINEQLNSATLRSLKHISEFPEKFGIMYVRGCNVVDVLDEEGQPVGYFDSSMTQTKHFESATQSDAYGTCRTYRVLFDSYQHYYDMNQKEDLDMYSSFNLLIRRSSAQNNFKSVLDTIRRLMNDQEHAAVPFWLHDLFLGYGDPTGSTYLSNPTWFLPQIDFHDTFLNVDHLKESFPEISTITFQQDQSTNTHDSARLLTTIVSSSHQTTPTPQSTPNTSHPYTKAVLSYELSSSFSFKKQSHQNNIRFTQAQIKAILSGVHQGLTMIVGPPGTGKTDTAVQIVNLLHKNFSTERILLIAHSNQALNDLFEKIALLNIDERYFLRLGVGEKELRAASDVTLKSTLTTTPPTLRKDFSKVGRVNHILQKRLDLLKDVDRLCDSLCIAGDYGSSCETAIQFFRSHVDARIQRFWVYFNELNSTGKGLRVALRDMRDSDKMSSYWLSKRCLAYHAQPVHFCTTKKIEEIKNNLTQDQSKQHRSAETLKETCIQENTTEHITSPIEESSAKQITTSTEEGSTDRMGISLEEGCTANIDQSIEESSTDRTGISLEESCTVNLDQTIKESSADRMGVGLEKGCRTNMEGFKEETVSKHHVYPNMLTIEEEDDLLCAAFGRGEVSLAQCLFPFAKFFSSPPLEMHFPSNQDLHLDFVKECFLFLQNLFQQIEECHAFELLRNMKDRTEYLLTHHAKVVAMTCTHAALARQQLIDIRFNYHTLIVEEAAQILEIETFIPMVLQKSDASGTSRLKRVILLGDHHQLPPVVKNRGFQRYGRLDQSMFVRFIRLQVPYIQLDAQGRCRPRIRQLFSWRYNKPELGDLPLVSLKNSKFSYGNPGFYFTHQWINVPDFNSHGESMVPFQPHMYQNLGEAEFVVAVFMYMRLLGYPAERIAILTTYNGQKQLLKEIVRKRCGWNPIIGYPAVISTVDRFQGQQEDYVLLSLVRTRHLGYLRDIRRSIVAVSRGRLGLYVFGRLNLIKQCPEWTPILKGLERHSTTLDNYLPGSLVLLPNETFNASCLPPLCKEDHNSETIMSHDTFSRSIDCVSYVCEVSQIWAVVQTTTQQALASLVSPPQ